MRSSVLRNSWVFAVLVSLVVTGCSGRPAAVSVPNVSPSSAASNAIESFDKSGDGQLGRDELKAIPGLLSVFGAYNGDGNDTLSKDEISQGIGIWADGDMGLTQVAMKVERDGRPLPGATVKLVPEPIFGSALSEAEGVTDEHGSGGLGATDTSVVPERMANLRLVQPGIYRVEITHPSANIPARYNTATELGVEITESFPGPVPLVWNVQGK